MYIRFFSLFLFFITSVFAANGVHLSLSSPEKVSTDASFIAFKLSAPVIHADVIGTFTRQSLLLCSGGLEGAYEYAATDEIRLYPEKGLHASTRYACKLNSRFFPASDGQSLKVLSETFRLKEMHFFKEGIVRLEFNDALSPGQLKKHLFLYQKIKLAKTKLHYTLTHDKAQKVFLARITEPIRDAKVEAVLQKNLKSSSTKSLDKTYTTTFKEESLPFILDTKRKSMPIYDNPRFTARGDGRLGIRIYFPGYFYRDENPLKPYIKIKGIDSFSLSDVAYINYEDRKKLHLNERSETYVDVIADFTPGQTYLITLKKGLKDSYQYQMREDLSFSVRMGDRKSALLFEENKPYLSSKGEIGFESVNLDHVTMIIEKIPNFNYRYFINFQKGKSKKVQKSAIQVFSRQLTLTNQKNHFVKHRFSLDKFTDRFKSGIFRIVMHFGKRTVEKIVYLSDIGISAKISKNQAFVSLAKLSDTTSIAHAKVEIFSDKNALLASGKSNQNGICNIQHKDLALQHPAVVVVTTSSDQNFLVLDTSLNKAQIMQKDSIQNKYKAWIYLQSRLIRPGSDAKILIVLKDKAYHSAKDLPVEISVRAPDFQTIYKQTHTCDNLGTIELLLDIPQTYKTGGYEVLIKLGDKVIGSRIFRVESFMPQKIKNTITLNKEVFFKDDPIEGKIKSVYFFGAPAAGLPVETTLNAVAKEYTNTLYEGYSFSNKLLEKKNKISYIDIRKNLQLSKEGEASFYFPVKIDQKVPSILKAQLGVSVFDDGKEVSTYKSVDIYPYPKMVGIKVLTPVLEKGEILKAKCILLDPRTQKTEKRTLQAILKKRIWHYFYDSRGYYTWEEETQEVDRFEITSGDIMRKKIDASGDYILEIHDMLGRHSATQAFSVRGWDYANIAPTQEIGKIQIKTDDIAHQKGDTLKVDLISPIRNGRLLVTVESDQVHYHRVVLVTQGTASLDIPLNFEMNEGIYVHASIVRSSDTPAKLIPFRAWGRVFVKADRSDHQINLSLQVPKISHSHQDITVSVNCDKKASVLVSLVDEGILQIIGQKPPKPFDFFNLVPPEKVALYDLYDQLMHYQTTGKLLQFGAGDEALMMMSRKHLAPKNMAKRVKPFVFWSGLIQTDKEGFASVDIAIPQFNGKAKIIAIALDDNSIGSAQTDLLVRDDIIIKPSYPRFALIGDQLKIPVRIFNSTKNDLTVTLDSNTSEQVKLYDIPKQIKIPANSAKNFDAALEAMRFGTGEINIRARNTHQTFLHTLQLPVYSADTLQTKVYRGETSKKITLRAPSAYFSKAGTKVKITLSKTYLSQLTGTLDDLIYYPYGCTEQTASKLLALLYCKSFLRDNDNPHDRDTLKDRDIFIKEGIRKLVGLQQENGDFAYWDPYGGVNPYASVYASDVLLALQSSGFSVPQQTIDQIYSALGEIAQHGRSYQNTKYSNFERLYAAYLLSLKNKLPEDVINTMYDQGFYKDGSLVSLYMMAAILQHQNLLTPLHKVTALIENFDFHKLSDKRQLGGTFYTKSRDLAFALYLHLHIFGKDKHAFALLEKIAAHFDRLLSTQEKAFALRAIANYYKGIHPDKLDARITYNQKTKEITKESTIFDDLAQQEIIIDPKEKRLNYTVEISGYIPSKVNTHIPKAGRHVQIQSSFFNSSGKEITLNHLKVGDMIFSKVILTNREKLDNIAVVQRIPACFDIINERLSPAQRPAAVQNSQNFAPSYQDIRDDRVISFLNLPPQTRIYDQKRKTSIVKPNITFFYTPLRVTGKGTCLMPATFCEAMYDSRIHDYSRVKEKIVVP